MYNRHTCAVAGRLCECVRRSSHEDYDLPLILNLLPAKVGHFNLSRRHRCRLPQEPQPRDVLVGEERGERVEVLHMLLSHFPPYHGCVSCYPGKRKFTCLDVCLGCDRYPTWLKIYFIFGQSVIFPKMVYMMPGRCGASEKSVQSVFCTRGSVRRRGGMARERKHTCCAAYEVGGGGRHKQLTFRPAFDRNFVFPRSKGINSTIPRRNAAR